MRAYVTQMAVERLHLGKAALVAFAALLQVASPARPSDGRLEINEACVAVGCFPGDLPGYPVWLGRGSYVLTSDLDAGSVSPQAVTAAIQFLEDFATLDLNGFTIRTGNNVIGAAILLGDAKMVEVRNGTIVGPSAGSLAIAGTGPYSRIQSMRVFGGSIRLDGSYVAVRDSMVTGLDPIVLNGEGVMVAGCTVVGLPFMSSGDGDGIHAGEAALVIDNVVPSALTDNIQVGIDSIVRGNVLTHGAGINPGANSVVMGNALSGAINACPTCTIVDNDFP